MSWLARSLDARGPREIILIRLLAGAVFVSEGAQKFLYPDALGVGRFAKIGIPAPAFTAPFVGVVEIACGSLLLVGLANRLAAIPLIVDMVVAISSTKLSILRKSGVWAMAHEARTDWAMICACLFLLLAGAGPLSLDAHLRSRRT
jgi:putative oxidoreductase